MKPDIDIKDHLELFLDAFADARYKERYKALLHSQRTRLKLARSLHKFRLAEKFAKELSPQDENCEQVYQYLKSFGAPDECILWDRFNLEGTLMPLEEALRKTVGFCSDTILLCIPGKLAYFEGEDRTRRILVKLGKPGTHKK